MYNYYKWYCRLEATFIAFSVKNPINSVQRKVMIQKHQELRHNTTTICISADKNEPSDYRSKV